MSLVNEPKDLGKEISLTIDDKKIQAPIGANLVQVAKQNGIEIPHYCYHPALPIAGNCRMCFVEIAGMPQPQIACNTPLKEGMVVKTQSKLAVESRKWTLEFLLANHPLDCPVCDKAGECELQNYSYKYGKIHTDFVEEKRTPRTVPLSDKLVLEKDRCILCLRCVNFLKDRCGTEELYVTQRGNHAEITTAPGKDLVSNYQLNTADICPVGALSPTNFRFAERVWNLKTYNSICPLCPRGCNTKVDVKDNQVQRMVPLHNPKVNDYWMCDQGRFFFHDYHHGRQRLSQFMNRGKAIAHRDYFVALGQKLHEVANSNDVLVLISNWLCNEDIALLKNFVQTTLPQALISGPAFVDGGDNLLKRHDFGPNARGLRDILGSRFTEIEQLRDKSFALTLSFAVDPKTMVTPGELIYYGPYSEAFQQQALLAAPGLAHGEIDGSYTNFNGISQNFTTMLEAPTHALSVEEFIQAYRERQEAA